LGLRHRSPADPAVTDPAGRRPRGIGLAAGGVVTEVTQIRDGRQAMWQDPASRWPAGSAGREITCATRAPRRDCRGVDRALTEWLLPSEQLVAQPDHRVVLAVGDPLLHRNERVVGDLDVLRAHLG